MRLLSGTCLCALCTVIALGCRNQPAPTVNPYAAMGSPRVTAPGTIPPGTVAPGGTVAPAGTVVPTGDAYYSGVQQPTGVAPPPPMRTVAPGTTAVPGTVPGVVPGAAQPATAAPPAATVPGKTLPPVSSGGWQASNAGASTATTAALPPHNQVQPVTPTAANGYSTGAFNNVPTATAPPAAVNNTFESRIQQGRMPVNDATVPFSPAPAASTTPTVPYAPANPAVPQPRAAAPLPWQPQASPATAFTYPISSKRGFAAASKRIPSTFTPQPTLAFGAVPYAQQPMAPAPTPAYAAPSVLASGVPAPPVSTAAVPTTVRGQTPESESPQAPGNSDPSTSSGGLNWKRKDS